MFSSDHPPLSPFRDLTQTVEMYSITELATQLHAAQQAISKERVQWSNSGKAGYLTRREPAGLFSGKWTWNSSFIVVQVVKCELEIYAKADATGQMGEPKGKPKAVLTVKRSGDAAQPCLEESLAKEAGTDALLRVVGAHPGNELTLGCKDAADRDAWVASINRASSGFVPSREAAEALQRANDALPPEAHEKLERVKSMVSRGWVSFHARAKVRRPSNSTDPAENSSASRRHSNTSPSLWERRSGRARVLANGHPEHSQRGRCQSPPWPRNPLRPRRWRRPNSSRAWSTRAS